MLEVKNINELLDRLDRKSGEPVAVTLPDYCININCVARKDVKSDRIFAEIEFEKKSTLKRCAIYGLVDKVAGDRGFKYQENDKDKKSYDLYEVNPLMFFGYNLCDRFGKVVATMGPRKFGVCISYEDSKKLATY
ncbi:MAG: hypothetical protein V1839_04160, partial [archaeon]